MKLGPLLALMATMPDPLAFSAYECAEEEAIEEMSDWKKLVN